MRSLTQWQWVSYLIRKAMDTQSVFAIQMIRSNFYPATQYIKMCNYGFHCAALKIMDCTTTAVPCLNAVTMWVVMSCAWRVTFQCGCTVEFQSNTATSRHRRDMTLDVKSFVKTPQTNNKQPKQ